MTLLSLPKPHKLSPPIPRLDTLHEIELVLRRAEARDEGPVSLAEIKRRLAAKSVRHRTVRTCVDELIRLGFVTEDPAKGVLWTLYSRPAFWTRRTVRLA